MRPVLEHHVFARIPDVVAAFGGAALGYGLHGIISLSMAPSFIIASVATVIIHQELKMEQSRLLGQQPR